MLKFEDPTYFWLLWIIPLLAVVRIGVLWQRRKRLQKIGDAALLKQLMPDVSKARREWKFGLLMAAIALMVVMLARLTTSVMASRLSLP